MNKKEHIKNHIYRLLWHQFAEFRNLSMDRQGEIVCQIIETKESLQNIALKGLGLSGLNKEQIIKETRKIVCSLEDEGIPVSGIFCNVLSGLHKGLKFLEQEINNIDNKNKI